MTKQLQDIVPDLSICQEAKDKGVEIESIFFWRFDELKKIPISVITKYEKEEAERLEFSFKYYPTPLTDEILEKLPSDIVKNVDKKESIFYLEIYKLDFFIVCYFSHEFGFRYRFEDKKLSNALYLLYQTLKDEGII